MRIAHATDFHVSRFGERMTDFKNGRLRSARGPGWEALAWNNGWRIEKRPAEPRIRIYDAFRLVDPENRVHQAFKCRHYESFRRIRELFWRFRDLRIRAGCEALAAAFPGARQVEKWLQEDPENTNLRFCAAALSLREACPDWVVVTGDLTDDGEGYDLIRAGLEPFIQQQRLLCIPGNHDIYPTPPLWNDASLRKTEMEKRSRWERFLKQSGQEPDSSSIRNLGEGVVLAQLDSCHPPKIPASPSGMVPAEVFARLERDLKKIGGQTLRLACLHHPIRKVPLPKLGLASFQPGMRLRNGRRAIRNFLELEFSAVLHGHRHLGYQFRHAEPLLSISAPSTTYGCRSGASPFFWCLEIARRTIQSVQASPVALLENLGV